MLPAHQTPRILVVNDSPEILELFRELLEEAGYEAVLLTYAPRDIAEIERVHPDLIILDIIFRRAALGWQLLNTLKLYRSTAQIPVIVCTGAVGEVRAMEDHLNRVGIGVVLKPFDRDDLLATIRTALADAPMSAGGPKER